MSSALIPLAIFIVFAILRYFHPIYTDDLETDKSYPELLKKYRKFDLGLSIACLLAILVFTILLGLLLQKIASWWFASFPVSPIFISPDPWFWFFPAIFLSVVLFYLLSNYFIQIYWKADAPEFRAFYLQKYQFDAYRIMDAFSGILMVVSLVGIFLGLNWYTIFGEDRLIHNRFFRLEKATYNYDDIIGLAQVEFFQAPNGSYKRLPRLVFLLPGEYIWDTSEQGARTPERDMAIFDFLQAKTGLPILELEVEEELYKNQ